MATRKTSTKPLRVADTGLAPDTRHIRMLLEEEVTRLGEAVGLTAQLARGEDDENSTLYGAFMSVSELLSNIRIRVEEAAELIEPLRPTSAAPAAPESALTGNIERLPVSDVIFFGDVDSETTALRSLEILIRKLVDGSDNEDEAGIFYTLAESVMASRQRLEELRDKMIAAKKAAHAAAE